MASNEEKIKQVIKDSFENITLDIVQYDFNDLKKAANTYIQLITEHIYNQKDINNKIQSWINQQKNNRDSFNIFIKDLNKKMAKRKLSASKLFSYTLDFRRVLDGFLERKIPLTLIDEDGSIIVTTQQGQSKIYKHLSKNTAGRGRLKNLQKVLQQQGVLEKQAQEIINDRIASMKLVFSEAIRRAEKKQSDMRFSPSHRYVYYRLWDKHHITGWGGPIANNEIAERYADVVLNRTYVKQDVEWGLAALVNGFQSHNWDRAIGGGDASVSVTDQGTVDFSLAIKYGKSFQTQGIRQYIIAAFNISMIQNITKEDLSKILVNLSQTYSPTVVGKILNSIGVKAQKNFDKWFENLQIILNI